MTLIKKNIENPATGEIIEVKTHVDDKYTDQELLNIALENDMFSIIHNPELTTTPEPEPTWAKQFTDFTNKLDNARGENFINTVPEFISLMENT